MKMKRTSLIYLVSCLGVLALLIMPTIKWTHHNVQYMTRRYDSQVSPVIFIPGSSATQNRFDALVDKLNQRHGKQRHSLLKVTVQTNDKISYSGSITPRDKEPFIVVGFENNRDGYGNIKKQARWFSLVFNKLADKYQFNNFKAVGHSNGGLVYTQFFEHYFSRDDITVKKLMTIGSPFNFSEISLAHRSQMLNDFIKHRKAIPKNLDVYTIAGTEDFDNDGIVPARSVEAGKYIYQKQVKHYTEITVTGEDAQHSDLPQNEQIVNLIEQYLLDSTQPKKMQQPALTN